MELEELYQVLHARCGFQPIRRPDAKAVERGSASILARVPAHGMRQWVLLVHALLVAGGQAPWKADVSKQLYLQGASKKMVYSWRLILQAPDLAAHLPAILEVVKRAPRPRGQEVTEFPLPGASAGRNSGGGMGIGRGATAIK